ncbi:hypothetical protein ASE63_03925 [Bosea sp. Root381]|uniref:tripartite tricarboxylate transporter TctB family protein n=1 Tax=Bosea sp. Root381 TaxID=1736524 RepID=UPI0006F9F7F5|nr:tripartite tricarboxylate transporter TctB family protein [Bosea sp. Root381]KRE09689.1 hypothetical protein ASE63_03925 [Bosea sp. Root381]
MQKTDRSGPSPRLVQLVVAVALFAGCSLYLYAALGFSFGAWSNPRAGFMPTIAGCIGVALALGNLLRVWRAGDAASADLGLSPSRALAFLAILAGYAALLGRLGFLPATFGAALALLMVSRGMRGPVVTLSLAAVFSLGIWLLFSRALDLPLP